MRNIWKTLTIGKGIIDVAHADRSQYPAAAHCGGTPSKLMTASVLYSRAYSEAVAIPAFENVLQLLMAGDKTAQILTSWKGEGIYTAAPAYPQVVSCDSDVATCDIHMRHAVAFVPATSLHIATSIQCWLTGAIFQLPPFCHALHANASP